MDIQEDKIQLKRQKGDYIGSYEEGKNKLNDELTKRGLTIDTIKKDKT